MKTRFLGRMVAVAGAALALTIASRGMAQVAENVTITLTALESGATNDNGTTTTVRPPVRRVLTSGELLKRLALDENVAGHYPNTNFPAGAHLSYDGAFLVNDRKGNLLLNVSDILTLQLGQQNIHWGSGKDSGDPPYSHASRQLVTLTYDATGLGGTMKFSASGLGAFIDIAGKANAQGTSHEVTSMSASLAGDGVDAKGNALVLSGGIVGSGAGPRLTAVVASSEPSGGYEFFSDGASDVMISAPGPVSSVGLFELDNSLVEPALTSP
ncbi:MAG TPA: hypothetical protein VHB20_14125 [Verrucomicrobiae bacterium]|jgi:hypothetical protein|nr:hypothetical protein [Verrucomicrobiae bacterium]